MISFNQLGNLGRLGNQMFQYASLKGIAAHRGYEFCIPPTEMFGTKDSAVKRDLNLYDVFHLDGRNRVCTTTNRVLGEKMHPFDEDLFNHCPDNIDLFGYYQTDRYFRHIEAEIRGDFAFDAELQSDCEKTAKAFREDLISLHVRRGDYVENPNHPVQPLDYYKQALGRLPPNLPVLVFSDDCKWCLAQDLFKQNRIVISQSGSVAQDLCMMSLCTYHIIANSSLSWWGAWLAKSQQVIAPSNWFDGACRDKDVRDVAFGNWVWLETPLCRSAF